MARKDELKEMCDTLGLTPNKTRKRVDKETNSHYYESSIKDYEEAVQNYYLQVYKENGTLSPFMESVLKLDSPMLALQLKNAKQEVQDEVWKDNNDWILQEKLDGCRTLVCYDKKYGWDFYSRNKSVTDCLPISYKTKLLFPELYTTLLDQYNISSFIIDSELLPLYHTVNNMEDGTELVADTQLNLVTSILGSLDELSHKMQKTNPLKFVAFDLIMLNGTFITELPLYKRDSVLNGIIGILKSAGLGNRIEKVQATKVNKQDFYNKILMFGGEGCLAKNINSKYDYSGRRGNDWIKLKRTVSQSLLMEKVGDTIDGFVTGFKPGNVGTANEGLVGALELSVYLTDDNDEYLLDESGNPIIHHIATVSGITQELRNLVSAKDENGNVILDLRFYGKVATIDGQDISSKNYRFAHATFQGWRPDRDSESCKFRKSLLERLVL